MPQRASPGPDPRDPVRDPDTFFETLDLLPQHLALMTTAGEVVRLNRWLAELLRRVPAGRHLEAAFGSLARSIAGAQPPPAGGGRTDPPPALDLRTAAGTCRLWGWCVELDHYGLGRLVLMTVQPVDPERPPEETLRNLGLTPKEAEVAQLLAEGRSNAGIAVALCISPHTARHHTERVMAKLGVRSRAEVGPRLRSAAPERRN